MTTRPETYIGRDMPGRVLGVVVVGVVVVGVVVVGAGAVPVVDPVPVDVPPPLACPNRETQQTVVRRRMRAEFRIRSLRIKAGSIMPRTEALARGEPLNSVPQSGSTRPKSRRSLHFCLPSVAALVGTRSHYPRLRSLIRAQIKSVLRSFTKYS